MKTKKKSAKSYVVIYGVRFGKAELLTLSSTEIKKLAKNLIMHPNCWAVTQKQIVDQLNNFKGQLLGNLQNKPLKHRSDMEAMFCNVNLQKAANKTPRIPKNTDKFFHKK